MRTKLFRIAALLLSTVMLLVSFAACSGAGEDEDTTDEIVENGTNSAGDPVTLKLGYAQGDPLNPFTAQSVMNQELGTLLYDPLFVIGPDFEPAPVLAESYASNGVQLSVKLKGNAIFSDGSVITAGHVAASFQKAITSPQYQAQLANFKSAKSEADTVIFELKSADPYAVNCLDFAIVKDPDAQTPIGGGRYRLNTTDGETALIANTGNIRGQVPVISSIQLVNVPDSDAVIHALKIGNISFVFDSLRSGETQRMNASTADTALNNLVYLGVNAKSTLLGDVNIRKAVSLALDREKIVLTGYQGHASAASDPFHPDWAAYQKTENKPQGIDTKAASALLTAAGYDKKNTKGIVTKNNRPLQLKLLVNEGNAFRTETAQLIADQLAAVGIDAQITTLAFDKYQSAISAGNYDLFLGEVRLTRNMDLSPLLRKGGTAAFGVDTNASASQAYEKLRTGETGLADFITAFRNEPPLIPLCYRKGISVYSRAIKTEVKSTEGDVFFNIAAWSFETTTK